MEEAARIEIDDVERARRGCDARKSLGYAWISNKVGALSPCPFHRFRYNAN
jgi:hypothetical protein